MTSLSGGFYAHQRGDAVDRRLTDQRIQGYQIEDLLGVPPYVLGRQSHPGSLADTFATILSVLQVAQLGVRGKLAVMLVADLRDAQQALQSVGVCECVLGSLDFRSS